VLPERLRDDVRALQESIRVIVSGNPTQHERLMHLRRAILDHRTVRFRYTARIPSESRPPTEREVDPYGLIHVGGEWHVTGYDHLRRATRTFRLDRMDDLTLLERTFQRPPGLTMIRRPTVEERPMTVRALFDHETARWVRESRSFFTVTEEETAEGLLVTLRVRQERDVLQWLLSWGSHVRILEPNSLRAMIVAEAEALARNHGASLSLLT
jgi:predicted DNA-binding transcriptional regulator YafY